MNSIRIAFPRVLLFSLRFVVMGVCRLTDPSKEIHSNFIMKTQFALELQVEDKRHYYDKEVGGNLIITIIGNLMKVDRSLLKILSHERTLRS